MSWPTLLPSVAGLLALVIVAACGGGDRSWSQGTTAGHPRSTERLPERLAMLDQQIVARGVRDSRVLQALRMVPRHWFVPPAQAAHAYDDEPLPIGEGQTISQPYIVALMTEALELKPEDRVLEIGTGSGYQAAVLSELTPHVFTIEIVPELARQARLAFEAHGYDSLITTRLGDGYVGWPEQAPFDAIIVTAAAPQVPPALLAQLAVGGRLCIPVGRASEDQQLLVITRAADGSTSERVLAPVRFVRMTGAVQEH